MAISGRTVSFPSTAQRGDRLHTASGQAVVTLNGSDVYLGPWQSKASKIEYDRVVGEWLAAGRCWPRATGFDQLTMVELIALYLRFAKEHYLKDGLPTSEQLCIKAVLRHLKELYGRTRRPLKPVSGRALKAVRQRMIAAGLCRTTINANVGRVRRMFRWAVAEEHLPVTVYDALATVQGLQENRCRAREPQPIRPVEDTIVAATLPHLHRRWWRAWSQLQRCFNRLPAQRGLHPPSQRRRQFGGRLAIRAAVSQDPAPGTGPRHFHRPQRARRVAPVSPAGEEPALLLCSGRKRSQTER